MEFDTRRVYTSVNADELKVGSKVVLSDDLGFLKQCVVKGKGITTLLKVKAEDWEYRFTDDNGSYHLAYLVSEPEEKKLKWTDLKVGDVVRRKGEIRMITGISTVNDSSEMHIFNGNWLTDEELEEWEKVEE